MQLRSPIELPETAGEPGGLGWVGDTPASEAPFSEALAVTSALISLGISHVRTHGDAWVGSAATEEKYRSEHFQCQWRQRARSHKTALPNAGRGGNPILFHRSIDECVMDCFRKLKDHVCVHAKSIQVQEKAMSPRGTKEKGLHAVHLVF